MVPEEQPLVRSLGRMSGGRVTFAQSQLAAGGSKSGLHFYKHLVF